MAEPSTSFLAGGGRAGELIRAFDWGSTPLGDPASWPPPLKTLTAILLASNQPMFVAWGAARTLVYNEDYAPILGVMAPQIMVSNGVDTL